jgi:hypothetical protein
LGGLDPRKSEKSVKAGPVSSDGGLSAGAILDPVLMGQVLTDTQLINMIEHDKPMRFPCECGKSFEHKKSLNRHQRQDCRI